MEQKYLYRHVCMNVFYLQTFLVIKKNGRNGHVAGLVRVNTFRTTHMPPHFSGAHFRNECNRKVRQKRSTHTHTYIHSGRESKKKEKVPRVSPRACVRSSPPLEMACCHLAHAGVPLVLFVCFCFFCSIK